METQCGLPSLHWYLFSSASSPVLVEYSALTGEDGPSTNKRFNKRFNLCYLIVFFFLISFDDRTIISCIKNVASCLTFFIPVRSYNLSNFGHFICFFLDVLRRPSRTCTIA
jgi:hypothetical protein